MRLAAAIGILAVTWAAAVYVHERHTYTYGPTNYATLAQASYAHHPSWEDPAAVLLGFGGLAVAVGVARR